MRDAGHESDARLLWRAVLVAEALDDAPDCVVECGRRLHRAEYEKVSAPDVSVPPHARGRGGAGGES